MLTHGNGIEVANNHIGIASGRIGAVISGCYFYRVTGDLSFYNNSIDLLNRDIAFIGNSPLKTNPDISSGTCGLAWGINLLQRGGFFEGNEVQNTLNTLDELLINEFLLYLTQGEFDYLLGMGGITFYFIHRPKSGQKIMEWYVDAVAKYLSVLGSIDVPVCEINLGVAHGLTGILLLLLRIRERNNIPTDLALRACMAQIIRCANPLNKHSYVFPAAVDANRTHLGRSGLSWSYGDLITSYSMLKYAQALGDNEINALAIQVLKSSLNRTDWAKNSLTICDGPVSIFHILRRIRQLVPECISTEMLGIYFESAKHAFTETYRQFCMHNYNQHFFEDASLLYGYSGALLSLAAIEFGDHLQWDECMLF